MKLKEHLEKNDISVATLARGANLPYTTVSELVNGKKEIGKCSADTVYRLAGYFGVSMEELLVSEKHDPFPDRFHLDSRQSLFLAKRSWDENVYCGMKMEARAVTFPQTKTILEGVNVPSVKLDDIIAIRNMRDAWNHILTHPEAKTDLSLICTLNGFIARDEALEWGTLRTGNVGISGTDYHPPIPDREKVERDISRIVGLYSSSTEKALDLFCYITYNQLFWDGNKRTALAAANKLLIKDGAGMMTIKDKNLEQFNVLLCNMYNTGDKKPLMAFLYEKAIFGLDQSVIQ